MNANSREKPRGREVTVLVEKIHQSNCLAGKNSIFGRKGVPIVENIIYNTHPKIL